MIEANATILALLLVVVVDKINHTTKHTNYRVKIGLVLLTVIVFYKLLLFHESTLDDLLLNIALLLFFFFDRRRKYLHSVHLIPGKNIHVG